MKGGGEQMNTIKKESNGQTPKLTKADVPKVIKELADAYGNVSFVARKLKVSRTTLYKFIDKYKETREAKTEGREELLDIAESALVKNILAGNESSIFFFLKTQGKHRGYVERVEYSEIDVKHCTDEELEILARGGSALDVLRQRNATTRTSGAGAKKARKSA